jgi:DUF1680 family protein
MIQGAIAYYRATGNRKLMDAGARFASYLYEDFAKKGKPIVNGHPELEMASIELYRTTGDKRYLELAGYLLNADSRESLKLDRDLIWYSYTGIPFTQRTRVEGHAVRAMYALSGATDYYLETGDPRYRETLEKIWKSLVETSLYLTGGVGARAQREAIGEPYELPNDAYGESCAAIGNLMWNWRLLAATGEARFADVMERALYNGINSGLPLDGKLYGYQNPLEGWGLKTRNPWYYVACCPPNIERTIGALPGYLYSTSRDGIYVHRFHNSTMKWHVEDGTPLTATQQTGYPWKDAVDIAISLEKPVEFTLYLRIPGWTPNASVTVNGQAVSRVKPGNDPLSSLRLAFGNDATKDFTPEFRAGFLGGLVVLRHTGESMTDESPLYSTLTASRKARTRPAPITLIPYYAWENRGAVPMKVWIPYSSAN